tara:strand:- start:77 stop:745 length:669 start_codon:yes stop_codon:yes gene_type:complete
MNDGTFIYEIKHFITRELCDDIITRFDNYPYKEPGMVKGVNGCIVDKQQLDTTKLVMNSSRGTRGWEDIECILHNKIMNAIYLYIKKFCKYFEKYDEDVEYIYNVWFGGKSIGYHDFNVTKTEAGSGSKWHYDSTDSGFQTCILYLNDIEVKDGGATKFTNGRQVQPEAGKIVLYPSGWGNAHRGSLVHKSKYTIVFSTQFVYDNKSAAYDMKSIIMNSLKK